MGGLDWEEKEEAEAGSLAKRRATSRTSSEALSGSSPGAATWT